MEPTTDEVVSRGVECPQCHSVYFVEKAPNRSRIYVNKGIWKLLCVCGHQFSFGKHELKWYQTSATSSQSGYTIQCKWKLSQWRRTLAAFVRARTFGNYRMNGN
jgi:hypothetical protein